VTVTGPVKEQQPDGMSHRGPPPRFLDPRSYTDWERWERLLRALCALCVCRMLGRQPQGAMGVKPSDGRPSAGVGWLTARRVCAVRKSPVCVRGTLAAPGWPVHRWGICSIWSIRFGSGSGFGPRPHKDTSQLHSAVPTLPPRGRLPHRSSGPSRRKALLGPCP
jgi:hypothetical protein